MANRQVVILSEPVPRLKAWSSEEAQKFVFDFADHDGRLGPDDAKTPMCKAVEPSFLRMLLDWPMKPEWVEVVESLPATGVQGADVQVGLQTPYKPASFSEFSAGTSDVGLRRASERAAGKSDSGLRQASEEVRVKLKLDVEPSDEAKEEKLGRVQAPVTRGTASGRLVVVYLSDAHVEAMLMKVFGPRNAEQAATLFRAIRMEKVKTNESGSSFANLSVAMMYVRKWREAIRWCARQMPRARTLVKIFISSVFPKPLATALTDEDHDSIEECMLSFIDKFSGAVESLLLLTTYGAKLSWGDKKEAAEERAPVTQALVTKAPVPPKEDQKASTGWESALTCFHCGVKGHIKPNCPHRHEPKKLGCLMLGVPSEDGPYVAVEVCAVGQPKRCLRMTAYLDGGAQYDSVGANWVPYLQAHGGIVVPLK